MNQTMPPTSMALSVEFTPYGWPEPSSVYLQPTNFFDFEDEAVARFAADAARGAGTPTQRAVQIFYAVRDRIRYDPYAVRMAPASFRASAVLRAGRTFCIPKAVLLVAAARCVGIPSAIGLSDVVNHFSSRKLKQAMGGREVFLHHGYAGLYLENRWLKVVPAFNEDLCRLLGVSPTEFDGTADAMLQQFDADGTCKMTYLRDHGYWSDLPYVRIRDDFMGYYPASLWGAKRRDVDFDTEAGDGAGIDPPGKTR